jgi:hypothetical protein
MSANGDQPVTRAQLDAALSAQTDHLVETMRDMQTEVLRAFESWSTGQTIRLRKLEADHSNLDAAASGRIEVLERRLFEIEKRLHIEPPKGT